METLKRILLLVAIIIVYAVISILVEVLNIGGLLYKIFALLGIMAIGVLFLYFTSLERPQMDKKESNFLFIAFVIAIAFISMHLQKIKNTYYEKGYNAAYSEMQESCDDAYSEGYDDAESEAKEEYEEKMYRVYDRGYEDGYADGIDGLEFGYSAYFKA